MALAIQLSLKTTVTPEWVATPFVSIVFNETTITIVIAAFEPSLTLTLGGNGILINLPSWHCSIFTARIRRKGEGNSFSLFVHTGVGGIPARSEQGEGGTLARSGWGVPHFGVSPQPGMGYPPGIGQ